MSEMVERVARALATERGHDDINECFPCADGRLRPIWSFFIPDARVALAAMREPTVEMIAAFWRVKNTGSTEPGETGEDRSDYAAYRAMIDAARPAPSTDTISPAPYISEELRYDREGRRIRTLAEARVERPASNAEEMRSRPTTHVALAAAAARVACGLDITAEAVAARSREAAKDIREAARQLRAALSPSAPAAGAGGLQDRGEPPHAQG
ncbi:hypothetical protein [Methylobacterium nodulans]|uniref:Uncharacterized protein n=1 Tax=Methylobacterium nodulans (strain LMG 21967 / CNCM I-2342 / ORS 2060) TaxID=460265 RepID=B8INZ7_METNO|nr:hypothetical protein [Methylobacterium nodulans]ACL58513.1 hypothetical protein Mnod_3604 [Methylobacterium nodulans ORS 2060]